jgi:hypothetical protein
MTKLVQFIKALLWGAQTNSEFQGFEARTNWRNF